MHLYHYDYPTLALMIESQARSLRPNEELFSGTLGSFLQVVLTQPQRDVADASGLAAVKRCERLVIRLHLALQISPLTPHLHHLPHLAAYILLSQVFISPDSAIVCEQTRRTWLVPTAARGALFPARCTTPDNTRISTPSHDMVNERPKQFGGIPRFGAGPRPGFTRPTPSSQTASPSASRATQLGIGLGKGAAGLGLGKGKGQKRHVYVSNNQTLTTY